MFSVEDYRIGEWLEKVKGKIYLFKKVVEVSDEIDPCIKIFNNGNFIAPENL